MLRNRVVPLRARATIRAIGQRISAHRVAQHLTQGELGRRARVSAKFIGEVERGTNNSSIVTLVSLADGLGCTLGNWWKTYDHGHIVLGVEDIKRVKEAVAVIDSAFTLRVGKNHTGRKKR